MSKSFGNVINPDDYVREYGADSLRMYEMFMGPFEDIIPWSTNGLVGVRRFLNRVYLVLSALKEKKPELEDKPGLSKLIHKTVKKVTDDFTDLKFNTAVSTMMEYLNARDFALKLNREGVFEGNEVDWPAVKKYLILLYPMAPHLASDLFEMLFESDINSESWPEYDEKKLKAETFQLVIQVNGKVRAKIEAPTDIDEKHAVELAQDDSVWLRYLEGRTYRVVFVPNRLINFIVS